MTSQQYFRLKKFNSDDHVHRNVKSFTVGDIFEILTIHDTITYAKVVNEYKNLLYDIEECTPAGEQVRFACKCNMVLNGQILHQIKNNDWRVFKIDQQASAAPKPRRLQAI